MFVPKNSHAVHLPLLITEDNIGALQLQHTAGKVADVGVKRSSISRSNAVWGAVRDPCIWSKHPDPRATRRAPVPLVMLG